MWLALPNSLSTLQSPMSHYTSVCEKRQAGWSLRFTPQRIVQSWRLWTCWRPHWPDKQQLWQAVTRLSDALTDDTSSRLSPRADDITPASSVEMVMGMLSTWRAWKRFDRFDWFFPNQLGICKWRFHHGCYKRVVYQWLIATVAYCNDCKAFIGVVRVMLPLLMMSHPWHVARWAISIFIIHTFGTCTDV